MIIALTGPIAAGKNTAGDVLASRGFACIDADALVHEIIEEKQTEILDTFMPLAKERGVEILKNGKIDRKALGSILFTDSRALAMQESIVHPAVSEKVNDFIAAHKNTHCVINATVLYKTPERLSQCACVLYIDAPKITRFFRVRRRNHLKSAHIVQRIRSQAGLFAQYTALHKNIYRVWNTGDLYALEKKVDKFLDVVSG